MNDRRHFLRMFGAGAVVVPVIGGKPIREAEARIIEPPKVELINALTIPPPGSGPEFGDTDFVVFSRDKVRRILYRLEATGVRIDSHMEIVPVWDDSVAKSLQDIRSSHHDIVITSRHRITGVNSHIMTVPWHGEHA